MDHKVKAPKSKRVTVLSLRTQRRGSVEDLRRKRRNQLLKAKRVRLHSREQTHEDLSETEVIELTKSLQSPTSDKEEIIKSLRRAFGQGSLYIDAFLSVENSMQTLVGLLTGPDPDIQLEAVWCITNIAAGVEHHAELALKMAAPYLITYLSSSNHTLVDQCAWALGNIAGDSVECSNTLREQGILEPLLKLLECPTPSVVRSALFALSNLARKNEENVTILMKSGVGPKLLDHLNYRADHLHVIAEAAWVLAYLTATGVHDEQLMEGTLLEKITALLVELAEKHPDEFKVATPLLRCLGNLCSGDDKYCQRAVSNEKLLDALSTFLQSEHRHVKKECLWALSNMAAERETCSLILGTELVEDILSLCHLAHDVKKEIVFCICNLANHGEDFAKELLKRGSLQALTPFLGIHDTEVIHVALLFVEVMLRSCGNDAKSVFEDSDGVGHLEAYEYHSNETIRRLAHELLDTYFMEEMKRRNSQDSQPTQPSSEVENNS